MATESRLATVIQLVASLRDATDDDPQARVAALLVERERIDREIEDARAGRIVTMPADRAVERAREALGLVEEVTADFVKYAESFDKVYREFRKDLVESDGSRGEVLAKVFNGIDVIRESEPGQVFQAFWRLLLDPTESARFEEALSQLVSRAFAELLRPDERRSLAYLKSSMMERAASVHGVQASFATGLQSFVRSREYTEQRRITRLLRHAQQAALGAADDVRTGQRLDFTLLRTSAAIRSVSQWLLEDPLNNAATGGMLVALLNGPSVDGRRQQKLWSVLIRDRREVVSRLSASAILPSDRRAGSSLRARGAEREAENPSCGGVVECQAALAHSRSKSLMWC